MADVTKIGLLVIRDDGAVLLCRKKRSAGLLILPGGKPDTGESHLECLERELREELGDVEMRSPAHLGAYVDDSADDPTKKVHVELYRAQVIGPPNPCGEIAELVWFDGSGDWGELAPSLARRIFPDLISRGLLAWSLKPDERYIR